ncbi:hypothetical protein PVAP13_1KG417505 [Panicum virgatum]|uniref:Uncharacterized protein n=1 Tax=Panicum virgatum TaxID=38727 RepID=A0A8T0XYC3_PANVG|nr:hypothetical protein PVAP13_1KG417505 [Panicum virgatum]
MLSAQLDSFSCNIIAWRPKREISVLVVIFNTSCCPCRRHASTGAAPARRTSPSPILRRRPVAWTPLRRAARPPSPRADLHEARWREGVKPPPLPGPDRPPTTAGPPRSREGSSTPRDQKPPSPNLVASILLIRRR